jgi:hypothetical protein
MKLSEIIREISRKPPLTSSMKYKMLLQIFEAATMGHNRLIIPKVYVSDEIKQWLEDEKFIVEELSDYFNPNHYHIKL